MTTLKTPNVIYYNVESRAIIATDGSEVKNEEFFPNISLTEKQLINIQLIIDSDFTPYTELDAGSTAEFIVDNDFKNPQLRRAFRTSANWTASGSEYYYNRELTEKPDTVYENDVALSEGTLGSLAIGEWAYGDNDGLGEDRVYIRLSDDSDPDGKAEGYLQYIYPDTTSTVNFIFSDVFNGTDSWYDIDTETYRDPDIAAGEITFEISANTEDFYDRLTSDADAIRNGYARTTAQIPVFEAGSSDMFIMFEFDFLAKNRYLAGETSLELTGINYYSKTEIDALLGGYIPKVLNPVAGNFAMQKADGTLEDSGISAASTSTDELVKVNASDVSADYLSGKVDSDQFEVVSNSYVSIKDEGLNISAVSGLQAELDTKVTSDALTTELELYQPKSLSAETYKATLEGAERFGFDDAGEFKYSSLEKINDYIQANLDVTVEYGMDQDANTLGYEYNEKFLWFKRDKLTADSDVILLLHMDGEAGSNTFVDDSTYAHPLTVTSAVISSTDEFFKGNTVYDTTHVPNNDQAAGITFATQDFDPGSSEFGVAFKFYMPSSQINSSMNLFDVRDQDANNNQIRIQYNSSYLEVFLGLEGGGGYWTIVDSAEISDSGIINFNDWNTLTAQRIDDTFYIVLNEVAIIRLDMSGKAIVAPTANTHMTIGYIYDVNPTATNGFIGKFDEFIVRSGQPIDSSIQGIPFDDGCGTWDDEWFIDRKYDVSTFDASSVEAIGTLSAEIIEISGDVIEISGKIDNHPHQDVTTASTPTFAGLSVDGDTILSGNVYIKDPAFVQGAVLVSDPSSAGDGLVEATTQISNSIALEGSSSLHVGSAIHTYVSTRFDNLDLQTLYDQSPAPQIVTDDGDYPVVIKSGSATGTDNVLVTLDSFGDPKFEVSTAGAVTAVQLDLSNVLNAPSVYADNVYAYDVIAGNGGYTPVTDPAFKFSGNYATGFYNPSSYIIGVAVSGETAVEFNTDNATFEKDVIINGNLDVSDDVTVGTALVISEHNANPSNGPVFIGTGAGTNDNNTNGNVCIGHFAGNSNVSGHQCVNVGFQAGYNATSGYTTNVGAYAGVFNEDAQFNVNVGFNAGRLHTDGTSLSASNYSTIIGANARGTNDATQEIVIGYGVIGNGSNTATIGNTSTGKTYLYGGIQIETDQATLASGKIAPKDLLPINETASSYTLSDDDAGIGCVVIDDPFTIPTGLSIGKQFVLYNKSASAVAMTSTGVTVEGTTGTSLSAYGMITVWVYDSNVVVIKGDME